MIYIGIDPGQSGGLAVITNNSYWALKMPQTERDVYEEINDISSGEIHCMIEKVHSMPGQGVASTFKFGVGYGGLRMALVACQIPFEEVTPQMWQKGLSIPSRKKTESKTQFKNRLKGYAQQLFPKIKMTLAIADALLIAEFCKRQNK